MTREETRAYFKSKELTYKNIDLDDLHYLKILLNEQFNLQCKERFLAQKKPTYWVCVNDAKYYKGKYADDGSLICAYLTGKGTYFSAREVISFNSDGFIGFCGEADIQNMQPVLTAFCEWCDWLQQPTEEE